MAADISNNQLPAPAPQVADPSRSASAARQLAPRTPDTQGRTFADELAHGDKDQASTAPKAADAEGKAGLAEQAKRALQPLRKAAVSNKQEIDNAPVVAFLTGHLEKLNPTQIPELVSGNRFLSEALGQSDLNTFLNKPMSVADLAKALDLPPALLHDAQDLGLDFSAQVTPADLLKAIGVDPQRVFAELKVLKDNVALDGVSGYINRAEALAPKDPTRRDLTTPNGIDATTVAKAPQWQQPAPIDTSTMQPTIPATGPIKLPSTMPSPQRGVASASTLDDSNSVASAGLLAMFQQMPQFQQLTQLQQLPQPQQLTQQAPLAAADGAKAVDSSVDMLTAGGALAWTSDLTRDLTRGLDATGTAVADQVDDAGKEELASNVGPALHKATFDAFAALGDKLRTVDTTRVNAADQAVPDRGPVATPPGGPQAANSLTQAQQPAQAAPPSAVALQEQLLGRVQAAPSSDALPTKAPLESAVRLASPIGGVAAVKGAAAPVAQPTVAATSVGPTAPSAAAPDASAATRDPSKLMRDLVPSYVPPPTAQPTGLASGDKPLLRLAGLPIEDLRLTVPAVAAADKAMSSDSEQPDQGSDQNRDQSDHGNVRQVSVDKGVHDLLALRHANGGHGDGHGFGSHLAAADQALSPQQRSELMQQVIDRATMLVKSGGGTVRLDLGSPELGRLELALNMQSDRIDLRVLAGSQRVRDAMMADLSQLRNALSVQNVRLGNVEVGIGHRQPQPQGGFAGFTGGNGQPQWGGERRPAQQNGGDQRQPAPRPLDFIQPIRRPIMPQMQAAALSGAYGTGGRIAVRA